MAAYHFLLLAGGSGVALIAFRYQLLSYFSDFMNFAVLKGLGGGNLQEAFTFGIPAFARLLGQTDLAIELLKAIGAHLERERIRWEQHLTVRDQPAGGAGR